MWRGHSYTCYFHMCHALEWNSFYSQRILLLPFSPVIVSKTDITPPTKNMCDFYASLYNIHVCWLTGFFWKASGGSKVRSIKSAYKHPNLISRDDECIKGETLKPLFGDKNPFLQTVLLTWPDYKISQWLKMALFEKL